MHVYFSGIGGGGLGPAALIAQKAGYAVSGSDLVHSQYLDYLKKQGIVDIVVGQTRQHIEQVHREMPIDFFVRTLALPADHPELVFCQENKIKVLRIDEFIDRFLADKKLKMIAVAGTHGKTTTTAMAIWLFKKLALPISYSVGAKISFGPMGDYEPSSQYFVYEADEFGRKFLTFQPYRTIIAGLAYDHHEIYPTEDAYREAFAQFISQSQKTILWSADAEKLNLLSNRGGGRAKIQIEDEDNPDIDKIKLAGLYNRRDAWLVIQALAPLLDHPIEELAKLMNDFPGLSRRFEEISQNLYTDYAHTPDKIRGGLSVAKETALPGQKIVVIYEPLTNRRMHHTAAEHHDVFVGADKIYWVPSYLAREDPKLAVLKPAELIKHLAPDLQKVAEPAQLDEALLTKINQHLKSGDLIVALSGGGGGSLDEWLRQNF